jgi:2-dehydropantoate 2-reductase
VASVLVMGAGAVGTYYGALLARSGHQVAMVARRDHLAALRASGTATVREPDGSTWTAAVTATAVPEDGSPDLIIVSTKSHDTIAAARHLTGAIGPRTVILSLQNGVENVDRLRSTLPGATVIAGLVFVGLQITEPGIVDHYGEGRVTIGDADGSAPEAPRWIAGVAAGAWDLEVSDDITRAQWTKLLWNIGFNAVCAVTGATAGEVLATPESARLVAAAIREAQAIAAAQGIVITEESIADIQTYRPAMRAFLPSTAQDIAAGRDPERDILTAFVMREGRRLGIPTPVNDVLDALLALQADRVTGRTAASTLMTTTGG